MTAPAPATTHEIDDSVRSPTIAFELLANRRRRDALYCLTGGDGALTIDELADRIARLEDEPTCGRADRVRVELHHRHLPKLLDAGVVRYDDGTDRIRCTAAVDGLAPYLELAARDDSVRPGPNAP